MDLENLLRAIQPSRSDALRIHHRLGILATLDPRQPGGFHRFALSRADERRAAQILLQIALHEKADVLEPKFRKSEERDSADWCPEWTLPPAWAEGDACPRIGTLQFVLCEGAPSEAVPRDAFLPEVACGKGPPDDPPLRISATGHALKS